MSLSAAVALPRETLALSVVMAVTFLTLKEPVSTYEPPFSAPLPATKLVSELTVPPPELINVAVPLSVSVVGLPITPPLET